MGLVRAQDMVDQPRAQEAEKFGAIDLPVHGAQACRCNLCDKPCVFIDMHFKLRTALGAQELFLCPEMRQRIVGQA